MKTSSLFRILPAILVLRLAASNLYGQGALTPAAPPAPSGRSLHSRRDARAACVHPVRDRLSADLISQSTCCDRALTPVGCLSRETTDRTHADRRRQKMTRNGRYPAKLLANILNSYGARGGTRTHTAFRPTDFKSVVSANSTTQAYCDYPPKTPCLVSVYPRLIALTRRILSPAAPKCSLCRSTQNGITHDLGDYLLLTKCIVFHGRATSLWPWHASVGITAW